MSAAYPSSLLNWTARLNSQTVWAADPNTLAGEIDAIESFVGVNPHVEPSPRHGATYAFSNLSTRVSQAMLQTGHPFVELSKSGSVVYHSTATAGLGHLGMETIVAGWPDYVSGGSIVIKDTGVWAIHASVIWPYETGGFVTHTLMFGGSIMRRSVFNWDQFPASGSNTYGERFVNQNGATETNFLGKVNAGTVVSIYCGNMTNKSAVAIVGSTLSAYFLRP